MKVPVARFVVMLFYLTRWYIDAYQSSFLKYNSFLSIKKAPKRVECVMNVACSDNVDSVSEVVTTEKRIGKLQAKLTKTGVVLFITSMCVALPVTLLPPEIIFRIGIIDRVQKERLSLRAGQFTARWLLRLIPFAKVKVTPLSKMEKKAGFEPSLWVCNHSSMLDVFFMLALDKKLRGRKKRPIKIVYWRGLESNPITRILFQSCGFIPIEMSANKPGEANVYDKSSFKSFLKQVKIAFNEGFDVGLLPEGQINPTPEKGLLPVFSGAYTLSRMSKRPIRMMALSGTHKLWYGSDPLGKSPIRGREVKLRVYPQKFWFKNGQDFIDTFFINRWSFWSTRRRFTRRRIKEVVSG